MFFNNILKSKIIKKGLLRIEKPHLFHNSKLGCMWQVMTKPHDPLGLVNDVTNIAHQ